MGNPNPIVECCSVCGKRGPESPIHKGVCIDCSADQLGTLFEEHPPVSIKEHSCKSCK